MNQEEFDKEFDALDKDALDAELLADGIDVKAQAESLTKRVKTMYNDYKTEKECQSKPKI